MKQERKQVSVSIDDLSTYEEYPDEEIKFTTVPSEPEDGELICLKEFLSCVREGLLCNGNGIGYWSDTRFMSNIAVDLKSQNLFKQATMFVERKKQGKWYPTHIVWFNK